MMADNNKGEPDKKKWKPPAGYKSAISKARGAARAAEKKTKAGGSMAGVQDAENRL